MRITVTEILRGKSVRGRPGVFGRVEVEEDDGQVVAVTFSRLDGEDRWYADSMWIGTVPQFHHGAGERCVRKHALSGRVGEVVEKASAELAVKS